MKEKELRVSIGHRINKLRKNKNITQSELGKMIGVKNNTISAYERGVISTDQDILFKLAEALGVSINDLFPDEEKPSNLIEAAPQTVRIPIIGKIACGTPITAEENVSSYRNESPDNLPGGNLYYVEAKGKSMEPTIPDGSHVLIREQPEVEYGEIAAVLVNDDSEVTLKRVKKQGDLVMLVPDNPDHEPFIITKESPARILGKALRFTRDL